MHEGLALGVGHKGPIGPSHGSEVVKSEIP
jgi:hypothetical protein